MSQSLQSIAAEYAAQNISLTVVAPRSKQSLIEWQAFQYEPPSMFERDAMFSFERDLNIAAVCGQGSGNLAIIDCETGEAFASQLERFDRAGIADTWITETPRGGHILTRLPVPVKPKAFKSEGFEVRAQGQYALLPPSIHPSGKAYRFLNRPASIVQVPSLEVVDWLKLEPAPQHKLLPRRARQILEGRIYDRYDTRSEAEQAVVTTLVNAGFSFPETLALFRSYRPPKFAQMDQGDPDEATRWLRVCFDKARHWCASDSPARRYARELQAKAEAARWPGRSGSTDRAVFLAHTNLAHRAGQPTYHASSRDLAEIAGVQRITATKATRRLRQAGLLELIESANFVYANRFRLPEKTKFAPLPHSCIDGVVQCSSFLLPDAFRQRGLGRAAFEALCVLEAGPLRAKEIADQTGRHVQTVRKALKKLRRFRVANKTRGRWFGTALSEINLEQLARDVGTYGARKKQNEKHRADRLRRSIATAILQGGVQ